MDIERYLNYKDGTKVDGEQGKAGNAEHAKDRPQSSEEKALKLISYYLIAHHGN